MEEKQKEAFKKNIEAAADFRGTTVLEMIEYMQEIFAKAHQTRQVLILEDIKKELTK